MPFVLETASAIFPREIISVIRKYNVSNFCVAYIDDILIFSKYYKTRRTGNGSRKRRMEIKTRQM